MAQIVKKQDVFIPKIFIGDAPGASYKNIMTPEFPYDMLLFMGGRGGAKTRTFAQLLVAIAAKKKCRILCARQLMSSIQASFYQELRGAAERLGLLKKFNITKTSFDGKCGSQFIFKGLARNPEEIKGLADIDIAIVDEAADLSQESLDLLIPTIRKQNSVIIFLWNPRYETDPISQLANRMKKNPRALVRHVSYFDNPFFPEKLDRDRLFDKETREPWIYDHIWLGKFKTFGGAFFSEKDLLIDGEGALPYAPTALIMAIDTTLKGGESGDGTGIVYAYVCPQMRDGEGMIIIEDWDLISTTGDMLAETLPSFIEKGKELSDKYDGCGFQCFIEDKAAGSVILGQLQRAGWPVSATPEHITKKGKDGKALALSNFLSHGYIKISGEAALKKEVLFKGETANHFLRQFREFKPGDPKAGKRQDDVIDAFLDVSLIGVGY